MKTLKFKTNIKCGACVEKVTPELNSDNSIKAWEVDLKNPDRTLTVTGEEIDEEKVKEHLGKAGYKGELIS